MRRNKHPTHQIAAKSLTNLPPHYIALTGMDRKWLLSMQCEFCALFVSFDGMEPVAMCNLLARLLITSIHALLKILTI